VKSSSAWVGRLAPARPSPTRAGVRSRRSVSERGDGAGAFRHRLLGGNRDLEQRGVEVHAPLRKLESIRDVDGFDLAIIAFWHVAERFLPELREASPSTRVIVDSVDLHFVREMRDKLRGDDTIGSPPARREPGR